jgi:DNA-directed RNA polymerase specialized sigma24 family protein
MEREAVPYPLRPARTADTWDAPPLDADELVREYYPYAYRLARSMLRDAEDAADAAQETMIAAARGLSQFRGQASFRTLLYRIGVNVCLAWRRRGQRHTGRRNCSLLKICPPCRSSGACGWLSRGPT